MVSGPSEIFENSGHSPQLEAPTAYNDALLAFIRTLA